LPRKRTDGKPAADRAKPARPAKAAKSAGESACPSRIKVQVRYYQRVREIAGTQAETHFVDMNSTVADLLAAVVVRHPRVLEFSPSLLVAVNASYAERNASLADGDIVDLMPPVSGG